MKTMLFTVVFLLLQISVCSANDKTLFKNSMFKYEAPGHNSAQVFQKAKGKMKYKLAQYMSKSMMYYVSKQESEFQKEYVDVFLLYQKNAFAVFEHLTGKTSDLNQLSKFDEWMKGSDFEYSVWTKRCKEFTNCELNEQIFLD